MNDRIRKKMEKRYCYKSYAIYKCHVRNRRSVKDVLKYWSDNVNQDVGECDDSCLFIKSDNGFSEYFIITHPRIELIMNEIDKGVYTENESERTT